MVKNLTVYKNNSRGTYRGISRQYYPRWVGWKLIENDASWIEIEKAVEDFYMTFYYYQLKLDLVIDQSIALLLFNFAVLHGKRKTIQKIQLVAGSIEGLNTMDKCTKYRLLLELLEFHMYISDTTTDYIWEVYREL